MKKRYENNKKKIDYTTMKYIKKRRSINLQIGKIGTSIFLSVVVFGFFGAISAVMGIILGVISLMTSIIITVMAYKARKKEKYLKFKTSKQLWYFNIFLGVGIAAGIGSVYNYYEVYKKVLEIIYVIMILYTIFSSQIIYYAAERKKDIYV